MISSNVSLKPYNTFGLDVKANYFASFQDTERLKRLMREIQSSNLPFLILGGGSNILLRSDYEGYVLRNELKGMQFSDLNKNEVLVKCGAGEVWHDLVLKSLDLGLSGLENLSLIPGSVGASPMQNIGAYGVEIKDVFVSLEAFEISSGEIKTFTKEDCQFGYRESVFKRALKNQFIITEVTFLLSKIPSVNTSYGVINDQLAQMGIDNVKPKDVSRAVIAIRQSKLPDPKILGNAGSFFKNPVISKSQAVELSQKFDGIPLYPIPDNPDLVKTAAGWLIEKCDLKGARRGDVGVHAKQALVLVNYGSATGKEIFDFSSLIIKTVQGKFGIELEREVNII